MKTPLRWLDARPRAPEARLLREVADEALPSGALSRAAKRFGVTAAVFNAASAGFAQGAAAEVTSAAAVSKTSGALVLWGTLGKATAVGLCVGALGVGAVQQLNSRPKDAAEKTSSPTLIVGSKSFVERVPGAMASSARSAEPPLPAEGEADSPRIGQPHVEREPTVKMQDRGGPQGGQLLMPEPAPAARARLSDIPEEKLEEPRANHSPLTVERGQLQAPADSMPAPTERSSPALAREVRALDAVREALERNDGADALSILNRVERQGSFQHLGHEAAVLRVEALGAAGRFDDAQRLARALLQQGVSPTQRRILERWVSSSRK